MGHPDTEYQNYSRGIARLRAGLTSVGYQGGFLAWDQQYPEGCPTVAEAFGAFKPFCLDVARQQGYRYVLWIDAGLRIRQSLDPLFEAIRTRGYLFLPEEHSVGEFCKDDALSPLGITREESFSIPSRWSAVVGLDLASPACVEFLRRWKECAADGVTFAGPKWSGVHGWPRTASPDERVKGHRHDQTAASVIAYQLGMRDCASLDLFHRCLERDSGFVRLYRGESRHRAIVDTARSAAYRLRHALGVKGGAIAVDRQQPLVSVIIPAYNAAETIAATLTSVLSQTGAHFEAIVVDDGSTDATAEIVEQIAQHDVRVRLVQQRNQGAAAARNRGIRESKGEWIAPLDADDLWTPDNLSTKVRHTHRASSQVAVIYSWSSRIDGEGAQVPGVTAASIRGNVFPTLLCHNFLGNGSCTLIRRSAIDAVGGYDPGLSHTEDWDLYLRLAERYEFVPVHRILVRYRQRPNSASSDFESMAEGQTRVLSHMRRRNANVPAWLCNLSRSNLYIYFASQNAARRDRSAMRSWLNRATATHRFAWVRPDWWWLRLFGGMTGGKPHASDTRLGRAFALGSQLAGSKALHLSLRFAFYDSWAAAKPRKPRLAPDSSR